MTQLPGTTPLIALSAVVLDTEATGLDPRSARLVQIGAVRIAANALSEESFETLVNPGAPIPASATAIHHITDADVAAAPGPEGAISALRDFLGDAIVIGHTIGFDLVVLEQEWFRAGRGSPAQTSSGPGASAQHAPEQGWASQHALDVRLLARVADQALGRDDLDSLCARFKIDNTARHSALGDARATARLFLALLPLLRGAGIRTLAEAEAACRRLAERDARAAGGLMAPPVPPDRRAALVRIDSFPYRHRVRDVMTHPPLIALAEQTVGEALGMLSSAGTSSVFVIVTGPPPGWGIVTERDLLRELHVRQGHGFNTPLSAIASHDLSCVAADDYVYRAIGRMTRLGVRHLGVLDAAGDLVGALTPRNLLRQRANTAIVLGDQVDSAGGPEDLAAAWSRLPMMARGLLAEAVDPPAIAAVISTELRAMTRRSAELAVARMAAEGHGAPPVPFCVLVLGSAGRGESLMAADQDNAIVFAEGEPGGPADRWFATMATHMNAILDTAGVPFCKGGVMAREAGWRLGEAEWQARVRHWVRRQRQEDLLDVDIFFDAEPVYGDHAMGHALVDFAMHAARAAPDFLKLMALRTGETSAPLTLFGRVRTDEAGRVDVKRHGLMAIFGAARVLAIRHGITERSTEARWRAIADQGIGATRDIDAILTAFHVLMSASLRQQLADIDTGIPPSPRVDPSVLPPALRQALPASFRAIATAVDLVREGRLG